MLSKTEDTDQLLIQKFQELMAVLPFEEITIKKITEAAGLNRPTFYNYFEDKYQLFDIILDRDLFDVLGQLVDLGMIDEAVVTLFKYFDQNKKFYHKAFKVDHPISFEDLFDIK